jgi:hypothetical protein
VVPLGPLSWTVGDYGNLSSSASTKTNGQSRQPR